jgi:hypothetical protein
LANKSLLEKYANNSLLVALIGLLGVGAGAAGSHYLTKNRMREEQRLERTLSLETQRLDFRKQAYIDFLQGQTLLQATNKTDEANQLITSAKLRILLSSSDKVLCSMADYWTSKFKYAQCPDAEDRRKDAAIYQQMRREFFSSLGSNESSEVDAAILVPYLWHCTLPGKSLDKICASR